MPAKMTVGKVQRQMKRLASNIRTLTRREIRKGKPISYGVFNDGLSPNEDIRRTPTPFSGGN
jgi:hypothetical protein